MSNLVWIPAEQCVGFVESQMAYGAIVRYTKYGTEFHELLVDDDYEALYDLGDIRIEMEEVVDDD